MKLFIFEHSIFTRNKEGYIVDSCKNRYEILSDSPTKAYQQVPPNSFLIKVLSSDGDVIYDFTNKIDVVPDERRIRRKIGVSGRKSLTHDERTEAVFSGIIP
mgnify:CR=1 FL=1|tara:strand:- start:299 stop:604 length:306 start_codon:yes stop_codon:yes gene_type:complete